MPPVNCVLNTDFCWHSFSPQTFAPIYPGYNIVSRSFPCSCTGSHRHQILGLQRRMRDRQIFVWRSICLYICIDACTPPTQSLVHLSSYLALLLRWWVRERTNEDIVFIDEDMPRLWFIFCCLGLCPLWPRLSNWIFPRGQIGSGVD